MRRALPLLLMAALALAGCGEATGGAGAEPESDLPRLSAASRFCSAIVEAELDRGGDTTVGDIMRVEDDGASLIVDSPTSFDARAAFTAATCVLAGTGAPATIESNMEQTSAMMGRQSATYDGITVQWTYSSADTADGGGFQATFDDADV